VCKLSLLLLSNSHNYNRRAGGSDDLATVFVGGLANQVNEDDLWRAFGKCGQIRCDSTPHKPLLDLTFLRRDIRVPGKGRFTDSSKASGIAFIEYETREEAKWVR